MIISVIKIIFSRSLTVKCARCRTVVNRTAAISDLTDKFCSQDCCDRLRQLQYEW